MASAAENLSAALLGRVPSTPDDRNYPLSAFLGEEAPTKLDVLLAAVLKSHESKATKALLVEVVAELEAIDPQPAPTPQPVPSSAVRWPDSEQLDQGQTPHCVGFGWAQFGNTLPIDDHFTNADGDAIYYDCKAIDGEPGQEDGSSVHSGAKAMKNRGRLNAYAWASSIDEVKQWVLTKGPLTVGTDWYDGMFYPDVTGLVAPTGGIAGGHCYIVVGYDPQTDLLTFQNSWGESFGIDGCFTMHATDFEQLLNANGEACTSVELQ